MLRFATRKNARAPAGQVLRDRTSRQRVFVVAAETAAARPGQFPPVMMVRKMGG